MAKLTWDEAGERLYETGVRNGVLYVQDNDGTYPEGVAWNGLTQVSQSPEGGDTTTLYADDQEYLNMTSRETFGGSIQAYQSPPEFDECDGQAEVATGVKVGQQARKTFGFCYRTAVGNDVVGDDYGYKLHLVYGAKASPTERTYETVNDSPSAADLSWDFKTTPVPITGKKPAAHMEINSLTATAAKLAGLEGILFGADTFSASSTYKVGDVVEYTTGEGSSAVTKVYVCKTAIPTAAAWDDTKWDEVGTAGPRLPLPTEVISIMTVS